MPETSPGKGTEKDVDPENGSEQGKENTCVLKLPCGSHLFTALVTFIQATVCVFIRKYYMAAKKNEVVIGVTTQKDL